MTFTDFIKTIIAGMIGFSAVVGAFVYESPFSLVFAISGLGFALYSIAIYIDEEN